MPIFACDTCKHIENTAVSDFWHDRVKICTLCKTGTWHERFPRISAVGYLIDQNGFLWHPDEKNIPQGYTIVGKVE